MMCSQRILDTVMIVAQRRISSSRPDLLLRGLTVSPDSRDRDLQRQGRLARTFSGPGLHANGAAPYSDEHLLIRCDVGKTQTHGQDGNLRADMTESPLETARNSSILRPLT